MTRTSYREFMHEEILTQSVLQVDQIGMVTVRGVADRMGMTAAAMYRHFSSLEELESIVRKFFWADIVGRTKEFGTVAEVELVDVAPGEFIAVSPQIIPGLPTHPGDIAAFVRNVIHPYQAEYPRRFDFLCQGGVGSPLIKLVFDMGAVSGGE